ncbi:MAG: hypothetical protein ABI416_15040 [Ginsengibacter sp.]
MYSNFTAAYNYRGLTYVKGALSDCYIPEVKDLYKSIALAPDSNYWQAYYYIADQQLFPGTSAIKFYKKAINLTSSNYILYQRSGLLK